MDYFRKALVKAKESQQIIATASSGSVDAGVELQKFETPQSPISEAVLDMNHIVARRRRDPNADIFRILRTKVTQALDREGHHSLAITSPRYGDGKTTVAVNLALSMALDVKHTVCLVDIDFRSPSVHRVLGINPTNGLGDHLLYGRPVPECMVRPELDRLVVFPIAKPLENSSEILGTPEMAALAGEMRSRYADRIVIYDFPPLLTQDDTIAFLPHVDAVIMVVREGVTDKDDMQRALNLLGDKPIVGTVLNYASEANLEIEDKRLEGSSAERS